MVYGVLEGSVIAFEIWEDSSSGVFGISEPEEPESSFESKLSSPAMATLHYLNSHV